MQRLLIFLAVIFILFVYRHGTHGDGMHRYQALLLLLEEGRISDLKYSMIGPLFSAPLYYLGFLVKSSHWWVSRFNPFLFLAALYFAYRYLRHDFFPKQSICFLLILITASMFPKHLTDYYGEVFSALLLCAGILALLYRQTKIAWPVCVLAIVNTPATLPAFCLVLIYYVYKSRIYKLLLMPVLAIALILLENYIRRGSFFSNGYEGESNISQSGFHNPFFWGLFSVLFSYGKGLLFFTPGLLLCPFILKSNASAQVKQFIICSLLFCLGLVLTYSKWWGWQGGWFWGPRFFLFASIPAAYAIYYYLFEAQKNLSLHFSAIALLIFSVWVGVNGLTFDQSNLEICATLGDQCYYELKYSVLWRPFVVGTIPQGRQIAYLLYFALVLGFVFYRSKRID